MQWHASTWVRRTTSLPTGVNSTTGASRHTWSPASGNISWTTRMIAQVRHSTLDHKQLSHAPTKLEHSAAHITYIGTAQVINASADQH